MLGLREITVHSHYSAEETLKRIQEHVWSLANPTPSAPLTGSIRNGKITLRRTVMEEIWTTGIGWGSIVFRGTISDIEGGSVVTGRCEISRLEKGFWTFFLLISLIPLAHGFWLAACLIPLFTTFIMLLPHGFHFGNEVDYIERKLILAIR